MGIENRYEGIDEYAAWLIRHKARQLVGHAGFTASDRDDLEQEMALDLLRRLPKYNPQRAQRNTFIARVIEHKIASILKARKAAKRDYRRRFCSLNERILNRGGVSRVERAAMINLEEYLRLTGSSARPQAELEDLRLDLEAVTATLPPQLRSLCECLRYQSVTEISRETGIPRATIYDRITKLRAWVEEAGIQEYF